MADDISVRIQRLIDSLRAARMEMNSSSKEAELLDKRLEQIVQSSQFTGAGGSGFDKLNAQFLKLLDLIDSGTARTMKLNGLWMNTAPLIRAVNTEMAKLGGVTEWDKDYLTAGKQIEAEVLTRKTKGQTQNLMGIDIPFGSVEKQNDIYKKAAQERLASIKTEIETQERLNKLRQEGVILLGPATTAPAQAQGNFAEQIMEGEGIDEVLAGMEREAAAKKQISALTQEESLAQKKQNDLLREYNATQISNVKEKEREAAQQVKFNEYLDKANKKEQERRNLLEESRKLYASLGTVLPGGEDVASRVKQRALSIDPMFTEDTLKRVETTGESGVYRSTFEYRTQEGVLKRLSLVTTQYGEVLVDTQKRFRTFGSEVGRNILEFTKWSIAVAAVYTPLQKLSELVSIAIDNQTKLADITVVVGSVTKSTSEIFDAAAEIAQEMGEELNTTLEAYAQAYKATGGAATATERFTTANKLLADSLILGKIGGLGEAEAIDTLSAALRQSNMSLDQGTVLLDKWVSVSKVANVDIGSLATGFAIVGDAAEAAGVDADKLNAILGVLAETGVASSKELGNQAKALISGMQSDQAQKALNNLGIATKTVTGDMRGFFEVLSDIQEARQSGALSDTQLSKLTLALGGGTRRQNIWQTIIEQSEKLNKIELTSKFAESGTAADAMGKKLETVNTATIKLSNSFQELAQALGSEGGILDITSGFLVVLNGIVKGLAEVTTAAGKAGPMLLAALAAGIVLSRKPEQFTQSILRGIGTGAGSIVSAFAGPETDRIVTGRTLLPSGKQSVQMMSPAGVKTRDWFTGTSNIFGKEIANANIMGSALTAIYPAAFNAINEMSGKDTSGWEKAGANLAGAAIGALVTGGNPIGAAIGSTAGETLVSFIESNKPKFSKLLSFEQKAVITTTPDTEKEIIKAQEEAIKELTKMAQGVETKYSGQQYGQLAYLKEFELTPSLQSRFIEEANKIYGEEKYTPNKKIDLGTMSQEDILLAQAVYGVISGQITEEDFSGLVRKLNQAYGGTEATAENRAMTAATRVSNENAKMLADLKTSTLEGLRTKLGTGEVTNAEYVRRSSMQEGANITLGRWEAAFSDLDFLAGDTAEDLQKLNDVLLNAPEDTVTYFTKLATNILDTKNALDNLTPGTEEYNTKLAQMKDYLAQSNALLVEQNKNFYANIPNMQQLQLADYSQENIDQILKRAEELSNEALRESGASQEEIKAKQLDITFINVWDGTKFIKTPVMRDSLNYVSLAETELQEAGAIEKPGKQNNIGFQTYENVTQQQLFNIVNGPQYEQMASNLEALGYKLDNQTEIAITSEGSLSSYTKDWKIVQYLLQQILKTEKDQLEGFYNFPTDMFPYIPVTPGLMSMMQNGGTTSISIPEVPTEDQNKKKWEEGEGIGGGAKIPTYEEEQAQRRNDAWAGRLNAEWEAYQKKMTEKETIENTPYRTTTDKAVIPVEMQEGVNITETANNLVEGLMTPIETLIDQFLSLFTGTDAKSLTPGGVSPSGDTTSLAGTLSTAFSNFTQTALKNLSTRLSLNINNRTVLQVSGRVLAEVVRPYLKDELVRYSNTGGSSVSANVV